MKSGLLRATTMAATALALAGVAAPALSPAPAPDPAPRDTVVVEATDRLTFESDSVTIRVGDVVTWRNAGVIQHSVTADPAEATLEGSVRLPEGAEPFDSGLLAEGETFSHAFRVPGRYRYFCMPHEGAGMTGTVIVIDANPRQAPARAPSRSGRPR